MDSVLNYDLANMSRHAVGEAGADRNEIKALKKSLTQAKDEVIAEWKAGKQGWLGCPDDTEALSKVLKIAREKKRFDTCLVLGVGGSDLGARAAYQALRRAKPSTQLCFAGANTDPDELENILRTLHWNTTLVNVVSKSGGTVETMSAFLVVRELLRKKVGVDYPEHLVATTDPEKGSLKALADKEGFGTLALPQNIGGRFSVLSTVGLLPLACAGIDVKKLLSGARRVRDAFLENPSEDDAATMFAALHVLGDRKRGQKIHVLMPYASKLKDFSLWFRQLWAESLGKAGQGPTPIAALGATDQHSQIQLYTQGPADKIVTFIEVDKFTAKLKIPAAAKNISGLESLAGRDLSELIHAERRATAEALASAHRPNGTIHLRDVSPESIGALFMFFEIATAMAGKLYGIDTYDQPGVEAGKKAFWKFLGKAEESVLGLKY